MSPGGARRTGEERLLDRAESTKVAHRSESCLWFTGRAKYLIVCRLDAFRPQIDEIFDGCRISRGSQLLPSKRGGNFPRYRNAFGDECTILQLKQWHKSCGRKLKKLSRLLGKIDDHMIEWHATLHKRDPRSLCKRSDTRVP